MRIEPIRRTFAAPQIEGPPPPKPRNWNRARPPPVRAAVELHPAMARGSQGKEARRGKRKQERQGRRGGASAPAGGIVSARTVLLTLVAAVLAPLLMQLARTMAPAQLKLYVPSVDLSRLRVLTDIPVVLWEAARRRVWGETDDEKELRRRQEGIKSAYAMVSHAGKAREAVQAGDLGLMLEHQRAMMHHAVVAHGKPVSAKAEEWPDAVRCLSAEINGEIAAQLLSAGELRLASKMALTAVDLAEGATGLPADKRRLIEMTRDAVEARRKERAGAGPA